MQAAVAPAGLHAGSQGSLPASGGSTQHRRAGSFLGHAGGKMMTCAIYLMIWFPKIAARPRRTATHREVQVPTILTVSYPSVGLSVLPATLPLTATGQPSAWPWSVLTLLPLRGRAHAQKQVIFEHATYLGTVALVGVATPCLALPRHRERL